MSEPSSSIKPSVAPPGRKIRLAVLLPILAATVLLGFFCGWEGSRRLYLSASDQSHGKFQTGGASAEVNSGVKHALQQFQDGYSSRDAQHLEAFMQQLFPGDDDILLCGTDAGEWIQGRAAVQRFIGGDWAQWGDVILATNDPVVSSSSDVAWLATTGTVGSAARARPIRFFAVLQRDHDRWLFRQIQFQWADRPVQLSDLAHPSTFGRLRFK